MTLDDPPTVQLDLVRAFDPLDVLVAGVVMVPGAPSRWTIGIRYPWGVREAGQA